MLIDDGLGILEVGQVECDRKRVAPFSLDRGNGIVGILLLVWQVYNSDIRALSRKKDGNCAADTGTENADEPCNFSM